MKYNCTDGNADIEIEADTAMEAAQEYCDDGEWGDRSTTVWIDVWVTPIDEDGEQVEDDVESITIVLEAEEPECEDGDEHNWTSPYEIVGGCRENPGVYGNGGGVVITEVCSKCGKYCITNTWAQRSDTGEQGLTSVTYLDSDDESFDLYD